jgi:TonB family protein
MVGNLVVALALTILSGWDVSSAQTAAPRASPVRLPGPSLTMPSIEQKSLPVMAQGMQVPVGNVDIETVVSATGTVGHVRVSKSPDRSGALDRACLAALQQWRFRPAESNGRPLAALVMVRFSVSQPDSSRPAAVDASLATVDETPAPAEWRAPEGESQPVSPSPSAGVLWPSVIREVSPSYTPEAMRAKIMGTVELEIVVAADGTVGAARITKSLDSTYGLDRAALIAARYWLFAPGTRAGVPVPTRVVLMLEFRLH